MIPSPAPIPTKPSPNHPTPRTADLGLHTHHVLSNGASAASQWQGEVSDLKVALRHITACLPAGQALPTILTISSAITLLPGYNLQRLVEHALLRNRDVVGVSQVGVGVGGAPSGGPCSRSSGYRTCGPTRLCSSCELCDSIRSKCPAPKPSALHPRHPCPWSAPQRADSRS